MAQASHISTKHESHQIRNPKIVPLFESPFTREDGGQEEKEINYENAAEKKDIFSNELITFANELPSSDLLLEVAMTTTFNNLLYVLCYFPAATSSFFLREGMPLKDFSRVYSFLAFFSLVWWVWASQVAFNVRLRRHDWTHRFFVCMQLFIFCALAAFTSNFDVTIDIGSSNDSGKFTPPYSFNEDYKLQLETGESHDESLVLINARWVSFTMAVSRLVLLSQYLIALFQVPRGSSPILNIFRRGFSITIHITSLIISSMCFFIAFIILSRPNLSRASQILKICLWFFPIILEVFAHFWTSNRNTSGYIHYPSEALGKRSATAFIIVLGGGLDTITRQFPILIGNVTLSSKSIAGLIICAITTFALIFSLFFGTDTKPIVDSRRAFLAFLLLYILLGAIVITLQGVAAMLSVAYRGTATDESLTVFLTELNDAYIGPSNNFTYNIAQFPQTNETLSDDGVPLRSLLDYINESISSANTTDPKELSKLAEGSAYQSVLLVILTVLENTKFEIDPSGPLALTISSFINANPSQTNIVNLDNFKLIYIEIAKILLQPATIFFSSGGATLIMLALYIVAHHWPRDRYEWGRVVSRFLLGIGITSLSAMNIGAKVTDTDTYNSMKVYYLANHAYIIPIFTIALVVEQVIELILQYLAFWSNKRRTKMTYDHISDSDAET